MWVICILKLTSSSLTVASALPLRRVPLTVLTSLHISFGTKHTTLPLLQYQNSCHFKAISKRWRFTAFSFSFYIYFFKFYFPFYGFSFAFFRFTFFDFSLRFFVLSLRFYIFSLRHFYIFIFRFIRIDISFFSGTEQMVCLRHSDYHSSLVSAQRTKLRLQSYRVPILN